MSEPASLFEPVEGGGWLPTAWARGPWTPDALHDGPIIEAVTWMDDRGLALAERRLWDERGPIGRSLQSLLVDDRTPGGATP